MQLVVKVAADHIPEGAEAILRAVAQCFDAEVTRRTSVRAVFPELSRGRRAGLFTIDLPDEVSSEQVQPLLDTLKGDRRLEYAERAQDRNAR